MTSPLDLSRLVPADRMVGEDEDDLKLLQKMLMNAEQYLKSFKWCPPISERFFGCGVGGIVATFLFRFTAKLNGSDDCLWVIDGDCPSAYLVTDEAEDPVTALGLYCDLMADWGQAVLSGSTLEDVFPVSSPATMENAEMLMSRIKFIREKVIPKCV